MGEVGFVRVTPKYVFYVRDENIFKQRLNIQRVRSNDGVAHVHPYLGDVVEIVRHWRVWESMTRDFLD